jgi:hypothetical protein
MLRRTSWWSSLAGLLLVSTLGPLAATRAADPDVRPVTTDLWLLVSQPVADPVTAEVVDVTDALHLVVNAYPPAPIVPSAPWLLTVHLNGLFQGTGKLSQAQYLGIVQPVTFPPAPIYPPEPFLVSFVLDLFPPSPFVPPNPCLCASTLGFLLNGDGTVNMGSLVVQLGPQLVPGT